MELKEVKRLIEKVDQNKIIFDSHFYKRSRKRPINESIVRSFLSKPDKIEKIERGKIDDRFKIWFKMSRKYSLVIIMEIKFTKSLKVISAWNTNRKWQKKLRL